MTVPSSGPPESQSRLRAFNLLTLAPELPVFTWLQSLDNAAGNSPDWLAGTPIVLDLSATALRSPGIRTLVQEIQSRGARVVGLTGVEPAQLGDQLGQLPPILEQSSSLPPASLPPASIRTADMAPRPGPANLLLQDNVRSGQQVRCPQGDVTVIGTVSSGAEILAGGSIHIYGTLRGRAIAGLENREAQIFCRRLEAELLAIGGVTVTADDMPPNLQGRSVRVWQEQGRLRLQSLD